MNKVAAEQLIKIAKEILIAGGKPVNRNTDFFNRLIHIGKRSDKATYKDADDYYYQWDSLHGEWQCYNKRGKHLSVLNQYGEPQKQAVPGRKIKL